MKPEDSASPSSEPQRPAEGSRSSSSLSMKPKGVSSYAPHLRSDEKGQIMSSMGTHDDYDEDQASFDVLWEAGEPVELDTTGVVFTSRPSMVTIVTAPLSAGGNTLSSPRRSSGVIVGTRRAHDRGAVPVA